MKHGIQGFPTIRYYPNGLNDVENFVEFQNERSVQNLVNFVSEQ